MIIIAILYYQNEKKLYFDLAKTKLQNSASYISSKIILGHMSGQQQSVKDMLFDDRNEFALYDSNKNKIFGKLDEKIDFSKKIILKDKYFILIDNSTYNHLDVSFIAIKDKTYYNTISTLKNDIIILFLAIYLIISLVGFYLAKLFLKPIKDERDKLNNFIKDTTHELNTPVSAILMSSEKEELSKKQVERIKLAAHKISEVYKDLTYIFLEDTDDKSQIDSYNLKELIKEQLKYFEVLAEKKRIDIKVTLEDTDYTIDKNDFIRLFNNVISNAIKYNKKDGMINIKLKNSILIIEDNGIGIAEKKIKDIFKRYYRATSQSGGFGIGLSIVNEICKKYSIEFEVNSKVAKGSTFSFKFK